MDDDWELTESRYDVRREWDYNWDDRSFPGNRRPETFGQDSYDAALQRNFDRYENTDRWNTGFERLKPKSAPTFENTYSTAKEAYDLYNTVQGFHERLRKNPYRRHTPSYSRYRADYWGIGEYTQKYEEFLGREKRPTPESRYQDLKPEAYEQLKREQEREFDRYANSWQGYKDYHTLRNAFHKIKKVPRKTWKIYTKPIKDFKRKYQKRKKPYYIFNKNIYKEAEPIIHL